ncbi:MAG: Lrp/AsnC family transcriptional regulator [Tabrizicola sp.]
MESRRVQALERAGIIRGCRAGLDPEKLGAGFVAYVTVGLGTHTKTAQEAFERAVARAPEVREFHNITGTVECLLRVKTADLVAYKHWHTEVLGTLPQVRAITTFVVMDSPKDDRA